MVDWRVDVHDFATGTLVLADAPFMHYSVSWILNNPGSVEAEMYLHHPDVTAANFNGLTRELRVYRNNVLCWGGQIWTQRVSRKDQKVRIVAQGYSHALMRRILNEGRLYTDEDVGDIAWAVVDWTQTNDGTLHLTDHHTAAGFIVDRFYCKSDKNRVGDVLRDLSEMDLGFDYWVTPGITDTTHQRFYTASPRRGSDVSGSVVFDEFNCIEDDYERDWENFANRIWGQGAGDCNPPDFEAKSNASISTYGEYHDTAEFEDLEHKPSVESFTREALRNAKKPRELPTFTMSELKFPWGDFDIGDVIQVSRPAGFDSGDQQYRVTEVVVDLEPDNRIGFYKTTCDSVFDDS